MIKDANFISVWDGGTEITTACKVDMDTKEVFGIEQYDSDFLESLDVLDSEYVEIDGVRYPVCPENNGEDFWYE